MIETGGLVQNFRTRCVFHETFASLISILNSCSAMKETIGVKWIWLDFKDHDSDLVRIGLENHIQALNPYGFPLTVKPLMPCVVLVATTRIPMET